ncbi:two-component regulator propeller domain-containing protein [Spirosoma soli]|uniref:Two-component regulator propeller domain-containing protein n=1 Tax=Spirosoma soli TaxID=1770529 RepID=A0ABW5MAS6_9BACT
MLLTLCLLLFILCLRPSALAQLNTWQSHFSYQSGRSVAVAGNKVYCATYNGFFCYDKETNETTTLAKQNGLSDIGISRLLYLADQNRLLIAYRSGNIDFLTLSVAGEPGAVKNFNTIVTAPNLPAGRAINHLNRVGNLVYLSTSFGLVVLDITRDEIRDTYFTEPEVVTYATAVANDSLYALTSPTGSNSDYQFRYRIRAVRLAPNVNIAAPTSWRPIPEPDVFMRSLVSDRNRLYVSVDNKGVYERQNGSWVLTRAVPNKAVRLFPASEGLVIATEQAVTLPNSATIVGPLLTDPSEVLVDGDGVWVADAKSGLLAGRMSQFERITPEGPTQERLKTLFAYPQTLVALPSSASDGPNLEFYSVPNGRWQHVKVGAQSTTFNTAAYLATDQHLYLGGSSGLWSQADGQLPTPVSLPSTIGLNLNITSLATDQQGNLWIGTGSSNGQRPALYVRRADGTVEGYLSANQYGVTQVIPDDNGFIWLISLSNELVVFDPQTNRRRSFFISPRSLATDRTGVVWIGTDRGPLVFDSPADAFDTRFTPQAPLQNGRRLLSSEVIKAIAVDGGNRKWLGTANGLYQVSPDGSQLLNVFTSANSPLPDNNVQQLAIEPTSGRVFILTGPQDYPDKLVSYGGTATEPAETLSKLTIFPNPVRPDFIGTVGINGLKENVTVKILDAGGQLVYETRSQGGTATWDLRDYRGRSAQTGVYLVVAVTADGVEGIVGKLAVVR